MSVSVFVIIAEYDGLAQIFEMLEQNGNYILI